jgi:hypothetical protein
MEEEDAEVMDAIDEILNQDTVEAYIGQNISFSGL